MIYFRPSQEAFEKGIVDGSLRDPFDFMYMGTERVEREWMDVFKHRDTRAYIRLPAPPPAVGDAVYRQPGELVSLAEALA